MQIIYTVPFRIHPLIGWVFKICTLLICIGAIIFATIGLIRVQRNLHPPAHPFKRVRPIIVPYK